MTEKQKNIERAIEELENILKQWKKTKELSEEQTELLFYIRDLATGKVKLAKPAPVPAPPPPKPKPVRHPAEMSAGDLFIKLDDRRAELNPEQGMIYDRLRRNWDEDGHTGLTLDWNDVTFLRRLYGSLFFKQ